MKIELAFFSWRYLNLQIVVINKTLVKIHIKETLSQISLERASFCLIYLMIDKGS